MKPIWYFCALLSGALYAFAFPNFIHEGWFFLSPIALVLMLATLEKLPTYRSRVLAILLHQTAFNLLGFYWVPATLQEFGNLSPVVSHIVALFLAPVLNPQWWGWLFWMVVRSKLPKQAQWSPSMNAVFGAILLTTVETFLPQQFPVFAGHVWMHFPTWLNLAPWGGVGLYSFFTWWLALGLAPLVKRHPPVWSALLGVLAFVVAHALIPKWQEPKETKSLNIRVVQANIGNLLKIESESGSAGASTMVIDRYRELTLKENPQSLGLIIWPETAYPHSIVADEVKADATQSPTVFTELSALTSAEILVGGYDRKPEAGFGDYFETDYNAAFLFGVDGGLRTVYRKHILIPFGETMPFGPLNKTLSDLLPAVSFFAAGTENTLFTTKSGASFVVPICYEILQGPFMAGLLRGTPAEADFIVNLTNDSWYGKTAEPFQHLFLAKWRALELRRPIVRSTNTGITTVIYPDGQEGRRLLTGEQDVIDVSLHLPLKARPTFYQRYGLLGVVGFWLLAALGFSFFWYRQRK